MPTPRKLETVVLGMALASAVALGQASCATETTGPAALGGAGPTIGGEGGLPDFSNPPPITLPPSSGTGGAGFIPPVHATHLVHDVPADIADLFATLPSTTASDLAVYYPEAETMFPPNIERILFQWKSSDQAFFHLKFSSATSSLDIYTDGKEAACAGAAADVRCFQATAETLQPFGSAVAGSDVDVIIESMSATKDKVTLGAKMTLHFSPTPIVGAIYYWSTTVQGIRHTTLNAAAPQNYLVPANFATKDTPSGECVACHTLSRSGKYLAFAFPGDRLGIVEVTEQLPPVLLAPPGIAPGNAFVAASWSSFNPEETALVVSGDGKLNIVAREDGKSLGAITLPGTNFAAMPDWSPKGEHIAFAMHNNQDVSKRSRHLTGSSISFATKTGTNAFGNIETVVSPTTGTETLAYPMFSPDGKWLAYSRANNSSEEDVSSEIRLAKVEKSSATFELKRANTQVHGTSTSGAYMNNMPTWAPTATSSIAYVAFSTKRDFGYVSTGGTNTKQLWIAAIDLTKVGKEDASFPAFRLEGQDLTENNHRPFWTFDVLPTDFVTPPPVIK